MGLVSTCFYCTFYFFKIVLRALLVNLLHDKKNTKYKLYKKKAGKKAIVNNGNFKETRRPQFVENQSSEQQYTLQRLKIVPGEQSYNEATNLRIYNSNTITVFSNAIASSAQI